MWLLDQIYGRFIDILARSLHTNDAMFDSTNPLSSFVSVKNLSLLENKTSSSSESTGDTFQQILLASMLSSVSSSSGEQGMDSSSSMLLPMMLSLIEKLIAQQVDDQDSSTKVATTSDKPVSVTSESSSQFGSSQPAGRPVGGRLTQAYHTGHNGLDFGIPVGTDVEATMDGKVVYAGWNNEGYGNLVIVENGPYRTYYAHLSQIPVQLGESVSAGSTIGLSGNTGNSTGPHLHYEARYQMNAIDPTSFTLNG